MKEHMQLQICLYFKINYLLVMILNRKMCTCSTCFNELLLQHLVCFPTFGFDVIWVSGMGRKAYLSALTGVFVRRICIVDLPQDLLLERSSTPELDGVLVKSVLEGEQERRRQNTLGDLGSDACTY